MGASTPLDKLDRRAYVKLNDTLTSGITKSDPSKPISRILSFGVRDGVAKLYLRVNTLAKTIPSDAALGFGEKIFSYPSGIGLVQPLYTHLNMSSLAPTGLSATAGEVGLGTTIASGANATLGAVGAAAENIMEGTTLANHVAATALTSKKGNHPLTYGDHGATAAAYIQDASAADVAVYLNLASTWDQTAAESFTFGATIVHWFRLLGTDFGVE